MLFARISPCLVVSQSAIRNSKSLGLSWLGKTQKPPCGGFVPGSPRKATTGRYVLIVVGDGARGQRIIIICSCDARCWRCLRFTLQGLPILNSDCDLCISQFEIRNSNFRAALCPSPSAPRFSFFPIHFAIRNLQFEIPGSP